LTAKKRKPYSKATVIKKTREHRKKGHMRHHAAQIAFGDELRRASGPVTEAGIARTKKLDAVKKKGKQKNTPKKAKPRSQGPNP